MSNLGLVSDTHFQAGLPHASARAPHNWLTARWAAPCYPHGVCVTRSCSSGPSTCNSFHLNPSSVPPGLFCSQDLTHMPMGAKSDAVNGRLGAVAMEPAGVASDVGVG